MIYLSKRTKNEILPAILLLILMVLTLLGYIPYSAWQLIYRSREFMEYGLICR